MIDRFHTAILNDMRKPFAFLVIALLAILVLALLTNPQVLEKVWLYLLGFIGYILVLLEKGFKNIANAFKPEPTFQGKSSAPTVTPVQSTQMKNQDLEPDEALKLKLKVKELEYKLQEQTHEGEDMG